MLEGLRAVQRTWIGKAVLTTTMGLIVVSFIVWGIGDIFRGMRSNDVARVGSVGISVADFRQAYQTELQTLQQQIRRPITNDEAHRFGLDGQVLSQMISNAVLDDRVQTLGLAISDDQIAKTITTDPGFAPGGRFDRARFNAMLREQGYTEQAFVRERRRVYLRQQFVDALVGDLSVPRAGVEALNRFQAETRSLDTLTLTAAAVGSVPPPDDAALQAYFDQHKQAFDAPQYRKLIVLSLTPASLAKPADVSDADALALYESVKDHRYGTPERRTLQQMVFPSEAEAAAASARITSGTSFAEVAKDRNLGPKDIDLGAVTRGQIFDKAVAEAAFTIPQGGTSGPIKSTFGSVLVHVERVEASALKPFEAVAPVLKQELAQKASVATLRDLHDKIEDARSSGKPLSEAVKAVGLEARVIEAIDAKGRDRAGQPVEGLVDPDALIRAAFSSDVGVDNDTVQGRDGSMSWFEVAGIDPARPKRLDEVKADVEAAWTRQEIGRRLDAKAEEIVKALNDGQAMDQAAASLGGVPVVPLSDVKRTGATGLSNETVTRIFDVAVGRAGSAPLGEGERMVFVVRSSVVPTFDAAGPDAAQITDRYRTALSEDLLGTYLSRVGAEIGAKVNQEALRAASGASL